MTLLDYYERKINTTVRDLTVRQLGQQLRDKEYKVCALILIKENMLVEFFAEVPSAKTWKRNIFPAVDEATCSK